MTITADELELLITAAAKDWADVEPAIFGTLLEKALDAKERGRLGAQFSPRAFVERLVLPTVMEPLRIDWDGVRAAAEEELKAGNARAAADLVRGFHAQLCAVRVLDPACGTGNFLYVTLELMKRLEGEVLDTLAGLDAGEVRRLDMGGATVDPHQFLGLDVNPRAVPVAELVLWIGYLQWHFRTHGKAPPAEPILRDFHTIQEQDALAVLHPHRAGAGRGRQAGDAQWGGRTKLHPITGEQVPDETDRMPVERPIRCDAGSMAGGGVHRRQPALRSRQGPAGGIGQRLCRSIVEGLPEGAGVRGPGHVLLVASSASGSSGQSGPALWVHHQQLHPPGILPPGHRGSVDTAEAAAFGFRHPGPSVEPRGGQRRGADCDDGGGPWCRSRAAFAGGA